MPEDGGDHGVSQLERELQIRDRDEQAARREVMRLTERLARQSGELARTARRLEQTVSALSVALRQIRADIERALGSRAWRLGHFTTRTLSRIAGRTVRTEGALVAALARIERVQQATHIDLASGSTRPAGRARPRAGARACPRRSGGILRGGGARAPPAPCALAKELRRRLGAAPQRERWPSVSVIVPTRDGRHDLERLFAGLIEHTDYPEFEVVVIDNGSSDDTLAYLEELQAPFPVHVLAAEREPIVCGGQRARRRARGPASCCCS